MKWSVTLVAELEPGQVTEHPLAQIERVMRLRRRVCVHVLDDSCSTTSRPWTSGRVSSLRFARARPAWDTALRDPWRGGLSITPARTSSPHRLRRMARYKNSDHPFARSATVPRSGSRLSIST